MKKFLIILIASICAFGFTAFGCGGNDATGSVDNVSESAVSGDAAQGGNGSNQDGQGSQSGNGSGSGNQGSQGGSSSVVSNYTANMNQTTNVAKTNVGVMLYAVSDISGANYDFTFENGSKTTSDAKIGTLDGKQYFRASAAGSYTIKVSATSGMKTATATKTITVDGDTAFSTIYNNGYYPDVNTDLSKTVVGQGEYYYDDNGSAESFICFQDLWKLNNETAYAGDVELSFALKLLPQTANDSASTIFFGVFSGADRLGDGESDLIKITRGGKVTIAKTELSGHLDLSAKTFIKFQRLVASDYTTTYKLYTSANGADYSLFGSAVVAPREGNFDSWDITGFNIFSQTPLMLGKCTVGVPTISSGNTDSGNQGSQSGNTDGGNTQQDEDPAAELTVNMGATTDVAKTNVGVILYSTANLSGTAFDYTFENGSKTTAGAEIKTIDGKQYMRASAAGSYTVKVSATKGTKTATATKTITVSDSTDFASVYNNTYSPDTGHPSYPSVYTQTVVGQNEYYYDNNGAAENSVCFQDLYVLNGNSAYEGDVELSFALKILPQTNANAASTIFFGVFSGEHRLGDGETDLIKITRGGKVTIAKTELSGTLNLSNKTYIKFQRLVSTDNTYTTTYKMYTSTDGANYSLFGTATVAARDGNYDCWGITGFNIFSQTPLMLGAYTVGAPTV